MVIFWPFVLQGELKNWLGENGSALIGESFASRPRIEFSNDLVGRTGVVYWNLVDELGDSGVCKTNGHIQAENKEKRVKHISTTIQKTGQNEKERVMGRSQFNVGLSLCLTLPWVLWNV